MQKALVILGMYAIIFGIAAVEVHFKLKKDRKNNKDKKESNCK